MIKKLDSTNNYNLHLLQTPADHLFDIKFMKGIIYIILLSIIKIIILNLIMIKTLKKKINFSTIKSATSKFIWKVGDTINNFKILNIH